MFNNFNIETPSPLQKKLNTFAFSFPPAAVNVYDASNGRIRTFQWKVPLISSHDCSFPQLNEGDFYSWHEGKMFQYQIASWIQRTDIVGRVRGDLEEIVWFSMKYIWGYLVQREERKERIEKNTIKKFRGAAKCTVPEHFTNECVKICRTWSFSHFQIGVSIAAIKRKKLSLLLIWVLSLPFPPNPLQLDSSLFILWLDHGQKVSENIIHQIKFIRQFMLEAAQTRLYVF